MAKTHAPVTTLVPTPSAVEQPKKSKGPTKSVNQVAVSEAAPSTETKVAKAKKASREACAAVRSEANKTDLITKAKEYTDRAGLRRSIVEAIQGAATVWDACKIQVLDPNPGKKHSELKYTIKKVDVGFALANGYITLTHAK